ncbi:hypothetical protein ACFE04_028508 [Oxalis oulophora]
MDSNENKFERSLEQLDENFLKKILGRKSSLGQSSRMMHPVRSPISVPFNWEVTPGKPKEDHINNKPSPRIIYDWNDDLVNNKPSDPLLIDDSDKDDDLYIDIDHETFPAPPIVRSLSTVPSRALAPCTNNRSPRSWFWKRPKAVSQYDTMSSTAGSSFSSVNDTTTLQRSTY